MTAWDWAVVVAVGALLVVASSYRRRDNDEADDQAAWQASTAVRTEADVRRDLDAAKADRRQVQSVLDLAECLAIWNVTQHDISHQTRRTEEDR